MRRIIGGMSVVTGVVAACLGGFVPASPAATPNESGSGFLVVDDSAGIRDVLTSHIRLSGVVNDTGRIVERDNQPGDSDDVNRDDLVMRHGTISLVNTVVDEPTFTLNPSTCIGHITITQTNVISGGTGAYSSTTGSFLGTLHVTLLTGREPDGSCSQTQLRWDIDRIELSGTLTSG